MRTIIFFLIALLAIPVVQVATGPRFERAGTPIPIDRSSKIIIAVSKHLRARDIEYPTCPKTGAAAESKLT
jgi:hypothetical protein